MEWTQKHVSRRVPTLSICFLFSSCIESRISFLITGCRFAAIGTRWGYIFITLQNIRKTIKNFNFFGELHVWGSINSRHSLLGLLETRNCIFPLAFEVVAKNHFIKIGTVTRWWTDSVQLKRQLYMNLGGEKGQKNKIKCALWFVPMKFCCSRCVPYFGTVLMTPSLYLGRKKYTCI